MFLYIKVLLFTVFINTAYAYNPLIRRTRYGFVLGIEEISMVNPKVHYYSYMGIPYAQPPLGTLRFKEPFPPKRWARIKETKIQPERCVQFSDNFDGPNVIGSEDCLYLNVFVPKAAKQELLPVLFWIHGGAFVFGSNDNTGPDYVMEKNVVLVTIQYRLNVFGFLSTADEYATGNYGLKDQVMALKWVKVNIKEFGGDPKRVTILGESAGGASVQYHILSSMSTGLFHRAISQSGSTLNRWALQQNPRRMVLKLIKGLGIRDDRSEILIQKLQMVDYRKLIAVAFNISIVGFYMPFYVRPFCPTIEIPSNNSFITNSTFELLSSRHYNSVPYILGYNTEEGSYAYFYVNNGRVDINMYKNNSKLLVPLALNVNKDSLCSKEVLTLIEKFYFNGGPTNDKNNFIKYMSQELFVRGIRKSVELMHKYTPLYYYRFSYQGSRNESYAGIAYECPSKKIEDLLVIDYKSNTGCGSGIFLFNGGVGHHEEILYLWYSRKTVANTKESLTDSLTRIRLVTLWTNFATTGNPTPENDPLLQNISWPTVTESSNVAFLNFGTNLEIGTNPDQDDYEFWEDIFNLCGEPPYNIY